VEECGAAALLARCHSYVCCRCVALVAAAVLIGRIAVPGQEAPVLKADSELVVLHVTVEHRNGEHVIGLVTVGLLIDSSASMHGVRHLLIAGAVARTRTILATKSLHSPSTKPSRQRFHRAPHSRATAR